MPLPTQVSRVPMDRLLRKGNKIEPFANFNQLPTMID